MQRDHIHSILLEQIVSIIYASPEPICFYKMKAHSGISRNECADAIAKHSALHDGGHDIHFQPPAPDGNAYTHLYWLAAKDTDENPSGRGATTLRLRALSDLKAKLKTECANHTDWGVPKQTQDITTTGRTLDLWSINKPQMLSGTIVISNFTKSVMFWGTALVQHLIKNPPTGTASLPIQCKLPHLPLHW